MNPEELKKGDIINNIPYDWPKGYFGVFLEKVGGTDSSYLLEVLVSAGESSSDKSHHRIKDWCISYDTKINRFSLDDSIKFLANWYDLSENFQRILSSDDEEGKKYAIECIKNQL